jgi:hypothetical protein
LTRRWALRPSGAKLSGMKVTSMSEKPSGQFLDLIVISH